jgi:hypothetical protein
MESICASLGGHPEFARFVILNFSCAEGRSLSAAAVYWQSVEQVRAIVEGCLVLHDPPYASRLPRAPSLPAKPRLLYREMMLLERKISEQVFVQFQARVDAIFGLFTWLQQLPPPSHITVRLDRARIEAYVGCDSRGLAQLKAAFRGRSAFVDRLLRPLPDSDTVNRTIAGFVRRCADAMGDARPVLPVNESYDHLMRYITSDLFAFSGALSAAPGKFFELEPRIFLGLLFDLISAMARVLGLGSSQLRALNLIVYRVVFDTVLAAKDIFAEAPDILAALQHTKIAALGLPNEFCPPNMDPARTPRDVFRTDPRFAAAVRELECICFHTNPLDILNCVSTAIQLIKGAATQYSGGNVLFFPFEVSFGLFVTLLLASDIPELDAIATLIQNYTPKARLCGALEYAKSNIVAAAVYCRKLSAQKPA